MGNKTISIEMTHEELKEIAMGLNLLSAERNCYLLDDDNVKYRANIQKYLNMDKELIRKIKLILLKYIFSEKEVHILFSSLYQTEQKYRDKYNDVDCEQHYHSERTKSNIQCLEKLKEMFDKVQTEIQVKF